MNGLRINNMNNLDDLIMNQGYMSQRTKCPRRLNPNIPQNQFFQHHDPYQNINKLNSNRDMSPNKIIAKNKPLLANNLPPNNRMPSIANNNFNFNHQVPFVQSQNQYGYNTKAPQQNSGWKNVKSPRSPQMQSQMFGQQNINGSRACYNHPGKRAQYMAETDGEFIYYCETCAAKLAAQRFEVIKLPSSTGYNNAHNYNQAQKAKLTYKRRQIPCIPEYKGNPVYESIIQFLKEIYTVQQYHFETYEQLEHIDQHYEQQAQMVDEFYRQLEAILQKMHQDHLRDLEKQHKKHAQMKDIYLNEIYQNLSTINDIVNDLDQSFVTVVTKITQEDIQHFNLALEQNRAKARFFSSQVEQQKQMFNEVISYKEERLMEMISEYEKSLITLWEEPQQLQPEKFSFQHVKNAPNPNRQPANHQPLRQANTQNRPQQQQNKMQFNLPSASNNILQPNNRENVRNQADQKMNVLQMHQNCQKPGLARDFEGKGACRKIFEDDQEDENMKEQVSPKFKNF